jgi:protease I
VIALVILISLAPALNGWFTAPGGAGAAGGSGEDAPRLLMVLPRNGFWYEDYGPIRKALERAGVAVTIASSSHEPGAVATSHSQDTTRGGKSVPIDMAIDRARADDYDGVVFVGGETGEFDGPLANATNHLIQQMQRRRKWVTSICRGNEVLAKSGVLRGKDAALSQWVTDDVRHSSGARWSDDQPFVQTDNILTGRHFHDARVFGEHLAKLLQQ